MKKCYLQTPSLFCAILLCLPIAFIFIVTNPTNSSSSTDDAGATTTTNGNYIRKIQVRNIVPSTSNIKRSKNSGIKSKIVSRPLPPPAVIPEDDESLFRIAGQVNRNPSPIGATKKLAFMYLTTSDLPFAPLWERFFLPNQTQQ
uniref:Uncharacterized protein n=1 Tax=Nelumbo nucifera TaxID=4432 RepID=A0A822Y6G6_NELNU|nr:TPA_asm: hypothetical protein HUJ06_029524 [Nelumbo nucifera]